MILVSYLKKAKGFSTKEIDISKPKKVRDILYFDDLDDDRIIVLVNQRGATYDTIVNPEDEITFLPVVGGG